MVRSCTGWQVIVRYTRATIENLLDHLQSLSDFLEKIIGHFTLDFQLVVASKPAGFLQKSMLYTLLEFGTD